MNEVMVCYFVLFLRIGRRCYSCGGVVSVSVNKIGGRQHPVSQIRAVITIRHGPSTQDVAWILRIINVGSKLPGIAMAEQCSDYAIHSYKSSLSPLIIRHAPNPSFDPRRFFLLVIVFGKVPVSTYRNFKTVYVVMAFTVIKRRPLVEKVQLL